MPAHPKPDAIKPRHSRARQPDLDAFAEVTRPDPPDGLLDRTIEWWDAFWSSDLARAVQSDTDLPALNRLAELYDDRDRMRDTLRELGSPITTGSQGQDVEHPLTKIIARHESEIRQLEDRFGLNPRSRIALGLDLTKAKKNLDSLYEKPAKKQKAAQILDVEAADDL